MKTVLVTGGTTRIGAAIAALLRTAGWRVLTTSHRFDAGADIVADFTDPTAADRMFDEAVKILGGALPDALVNNAALFVAEPAALKTINLDAPVRLTERMANRLSGVGAVVNVLDCKVLGACPAELSPYLETKRALRDATVRMARDAAPRLRVNGVAPGPVLAPTQVHEKAGDLLLAQRPTVDDVAQAVVYLLSASSTTGAIIPVDAGQHLLVP